MWDLNISALKCLNLIWDKIRESSNNSMNGPICQCFTNVGECITMKHHPGHSSSDFTSISSEKNIKLENYVKYSRQQ